MGNTIKQWKRSSVKGIAKSAINPALLRRFRDYFTEAQGPRFAGKAFKERSKDLDMSLKYNEQTLIDNPMSNRFYGGDGDEMEPGKGKYRISHPSTAIESIYVDKSETKGNRFLVAIAFKGAPNNFYNYWATEDELQDLINAGSKGREVAYYWNHNDEKHYP